MPKDASIRGQAERAVRTVVVADMVESVRLMEEDEANIVARWRALVGRVERYILPSHEGRLVKSLGDGMLLEFPRVQGAMKAAFDIQRACGEVNFGLPPDRRMLLRMGAQVGEIIADDHDVYGRGVNLAARLAGLAGPGEIVVSDGVRDQLIPVLDADIEDLGECYLKHMREPVRAYRVGPPGPSPVIPPPPAQLQPTVAVIPFAMRAGGAEHEVLGEMLADDVISAFSKATDLSVISRLSTSAFRARNASLAEIGAHLHAGYILSGAYRAAGDRLTLTMELAETKSGRVLLSDELRGKVSAVIAGESEIVDRLVAEASGAIIARELERTRGQALPNLESGTLLISAIHLMHRLSRRDFERAHEMLEALVERVPRQPVPRAWLGKWHVLRVQQGWSDDTKKDTQLALDCTRRALDLDGHCALALTIDGFVHTNLLRRLDVALERYEHALRVNPNDALAWLLKGTLHAFRGEGEAAVKGTHRALRLSPLDPHRYFFESLSATAELSAERYERAMEMARRSLRHNRTHTSTLRALAIAQWQLGNAADARASVAELLRLDPTFTITRFLERSPSAPFSTGKVWSAALRSAGVPE